MFPIPQSTSFVAVFKAYSSDHVSEATGKTIAITISKAGGAFGNPNVGATNATEISSGWYKVTLDTTDTATLGILALRGTAATIDDVGDRFYVVSASTGGLTNLDAAISSRMAAYTQPSGFLAATFPALVASPTNITAAAGVAVSSIGNGVITAASIASDAITDAKVASDVTIASVTGAVGSVTGAVASVTGDVGGNVTGTIGGLTAAALKDFFDTDSATTYASAVSGSVVKEIVAHSGGPDLTVPVAAIQAQTDKLTFDGANHVVADARKLSTSSLAADNLEAGADALVVSTCAAGSTTTLIVTNLTESTNDHYNGRAITFISGALTGQATSISAYNGTTHTLTVVALTEAPANTDSFVIS